MVAALLSRGIIARGLPYANSVAFSPPLIISDGEIDEIVEAVDAAGRPRGRRLKERAHAASSRTTASPNAGSSSVTESSAIRGPERSPKIASTSPTVTSTAPIVNARW